jgi:mannitol-1-/sugar-/sorbitol-6-phosphatase
VPERAVAGVLLDMDGTLVDSTAVVEAMWRRFATRHDVDPARLLRYSHGRLTVDTVTAFLPDGHGVPAAAAALEAEQLRELDGIVEIPGAGRFLRALAGAGARVGVVTSAPRELAVRRLAAAGLPVPPVLVTAEDVAVGKPSPEGYLRGAAALGLPVRDCAIFEDAEAGIRAALATSAWTVVVGGHESPTTVGLARVADFRDVRLRCDGVDGVVLGVAG